MPQTNTSAKEPEHTPFKKIVFQTLRETWQELHNNRLLYKDLAQDYRDTRRMHKEIRRDLDALDVEHSDQQRLQNLQTRMRESDKTMDNLNASLTGIKRTICRQQWRFFWSTVRLLLQLGIAIILTNVLFILAAMPLLVLAQNLYSSPSLFVAVSNLFVIESAATAAVFAGLMFAMARDKNLSQLQSALASRSALGLFALTVFLGTAFLLVSFNSLDGPHKPAWFEGLSNITLSMLAAGSIAALLAGLGPALILAWHGVWRLSFGEQELNSE